MQKEPHAYTRAHIDKHGRIIVPAEIRRELKMVPGEALTMWVENGELRVIPSVWGHYAGRRGILEPGDAEEGLRAAAAIGDDRLQRQSQGRVVPESFTHGSSEQRMTWLRRGMESGRMEACDTFSAGT